MESQLVQLNSKLDKIIELLEKMNKEPVKESKKTKETKDETGTDWSIEYYKESVLIKFSFNTKFKEFIKQHGGTWLVSKKSWMFPKSRQQEVIDLVSDNFAEWIFTDKRSTEEV